MLQAFALDRGRTMAAKTAWAAFPHDAKAYAFAGDALKKAWPQLHAGDCEPFPDAKHAAALLKAAGKAAPKLDTETLASVLQDAWRAFHRGDFKAAFDAGEKLGPVGASVAVKALGIHATYLIDDDAEKLKRFEQAGKLAEAAIKALPGEANSYYRHAFAMGRYSQGLSIAKALKQGIAGKVRTSLDTALELAPKHAEAHTALALYHAEIIGKIGAMIGGLTYCAMASEAEPEAAKEEGDASRAVAAVKETLGERVKDVRISRRLTESASCLVAAEGDPGVNLERIMKMVDQSARESTRILELNPTHPFVKN